MDNNAIHPPMWKNLTAHQQRVLVALRELTARRGWAWWDRHDIGRIIAAGGYHQTIQHATIDRLEEFGLVQNQRSSWPAEVRELVTCPCGLQYFGLTPRGAEIAARLAVRITAEAIHRIEQLVTLPHPDDWGCDEEY